MAWRGGGIGGEDWGSCFASGPLPSVGRCAGRGPRWWCHQVAIVWPCRLSVDEYLAAGRSVAVPRADCPGCATGLAFRSGYERSVRVGGLCHQLWVRRGECRACGASHALLPSFLVRGRLDVVDTIGVVLDTVVGGVSGVRKVAEELKVPHTTARDWVRRFRGRAAALAAGLAAAVVELAGVAPRLPLDAGRAVIEALKWAWAAARARAGPGLPGRWGFASVITGGRFLAGAMDPPLLVIGRRRLIPPVP